VLGLGLGQVGRQGQAAHSQAMRSALVVVSCAPGRVDGEVAGVNRARPESFAWRIREAVGQPPNCWVICLNRRT
jgi:hypothetical protein